MYTYNRYIPSYSDRQLDIAINKLKSQYNRAKLANNKNLMRDITLQITTAYKFN